ncbi:MAG: PA14 domain-containing protein [Tepidisphaeraceae bacterium]
MANNIAFINYGTGPDPIATISGWINSGFNRGAWNGSGIISSLAQTNSNYAVGYADAADAGNPANLQSGTIKIMYTLLGDAQLNGAVNGNDFAIVTTNLGNEVSGWDQGDFAYSGSVNGTDYEYVTANLGKGDNVAVSPASPPASVSSFTASADSPTCINLSWTEVADAGAGFTILRCQGGGNYTDLANVAAGSSSYQDTGLTPGSQYGYELEATSPAGDSPATAASATTPLITIPSGFQATSVSNTEIDLAWTDKANDETGFVIQRSLDGVNFTTLATVGAGVNQYADTGLNSGTNYWYRIQAVNGSAASGLSNIVSSMTVSVGASPVAYLSAATASDAAINLLWVDNSSGTTGFVIQRSSDGTDGWTTIQTVAAGMDGYQDSGLTQTTTYYYRVLASDGGAASSPSNVASATTATTFVSSGQPDPTQEDGFNFDNFNPVYLVSGERSNIFYVGQPVDFTLTNNGQATNAGISNQASTYQVRDYYGDIVAQGAVNGNNLPINVTAPGWYKVYLFGSQSSAEFGNTVGGTTFVIFRNDLSMPALPAESMTPGTFPGSPLVTEIDPQVNINSNTPNFQPVPTIGGNIFSVKWTGQVLADYTGTYTFYTESDDGVRLWVNGQELINHWTDHSEAQDSGTITLTAGQRYNIEMDYYQDGGGAIAQLLWSTPAQPTMTMIDSGHLFASVTATSPGGLTGQYWGILTGNIAGIDAVVNDVIGMGPERYSVENAADPTDAIAQLTADIDIDEQMYIPYDSNAQLLIAFPNLNTSDPAQIAGVEAIVSHFAGIVENYEGMNEPNFSYSGAQYVPIEEAFYNAVKAGDPNANVLGPAIVTIGPYGLNWANDFFANGGGNYINAFSFHAYNNNNGDLTLIRESLQSLTNLLGQYGLGNIPIWQTEQGYTADNYGAYTPDLQANWTMLQMMAFDQYGISKEQNYYWYDSSLGNWSFPEFWENPDGSLNPVADLMRVWSEELQGTNYTSAYDFGPQADNLYLGNLYTGSGKTVAAFMSAGNSTGNILLSVTGTEANGTNAIHVISPFGVAEDLAVVNGYVDLPVGLLPEYVEVAPGQKLQVVTQNWGPDLAMEAGVTITASNPNNGTQLLNNGVLEDWFWGQQPSDNAFIMSFDNSSPATIELDLPTAQEIDRVVLYTSVPWELSGSLLNFDLQYYVNGNWVTLQQVSNDPKTLGVYTPTLQTSVDSYYNDQSAFEMDFAPVTTSKIRLVINEATYGGAATQLAYAAGALGSASPTVTLRELEVFGS